jgi:hypothetical protein
MYSRQSLIVILLATVALTLMGPAVSGISLLQQQAKAEKSGQIGEDGFNECTLKSQCDIDGGFGGVDNVANSNNSLNGNGGDGGLARCFNAATDCFVQARGGNGGHDNSHNSGNSNNGNGGKGGVGGICLSGCLAIGGRGGDRNSGNTNGNNGNGGEGRPGISLRYC